MSDIEALRAGLRIDKYALDDALVQQPETLYEVGMLYARASDKRDTLKDNLSRVHAEVYESIRQEKLRASEKFTESVLSNLVLQDARHKDASSEYLDAKAEAAELLELKEAYSQRTFMVKDLCNLYCNEYFARSATSSAGATVNTAKNLEAEGAKAAQAQVRRRRSKKDSS